MKNLIKEKFNLTDIQAAAAYEIARHGYITVNILNIIAANYKKNYMYNVIKRLEKLKLVRLKATKIIPGSKYIIYPKQKLKDALKGVYVVPRPPKSAIQYRHNLIAIAVILMEKQLRDADGYITTNQINKLKDKGKWRSRKTPDGIVTKNYRGYLIEVELHIKSYAKYQQAFNHIETESLKPIYKGWIKNIYYVDTRKAEKKMNKIINWIKTKGSTTAMETAANTEVIYLQDLLDEFNAAKNTDVKLDIFHPVI